MINIGFDFDNTIISYEKSFYFLACKIYKMPSDIEKDKASVRQFFINSEREEEFTELQGLVYGKEIMKAFNLKPCKAIGQIKEAIKEAILEGDINNNYDDAYNIMLKEGKKLGLSTNEKR